ncbi:MAG: ABC transporter substrate-binding protein [Gammaproteobacteria bacterium]|nr:ABC transporter substrate-binding protein [Gammaproteobacteria bacterium]
MNTLKKFVFIAALLAISLGKAQEPPMTAMATVQGGVQVLLDTVQSSKSYFLSDQQRYYDNIESALTTIVDFDAVARVVMSRYAQNASAAQVSRFGDILSTTLTRFYGAALVAYDGQELSFIPSSNEPTDPRADRVIGMEIKGIGNGNGNGSFKLQYQMFVNENDEWKLKNLSLGGINLGRQYYTQFAAAMSQYNNDIDQVLANWQQ